MRFRTRVSFLIHSPEFVARQLHTKPRQLRPPSAAFFLTLTIGSIVFAVENLANILSMEGAVAVAWIGLCVAILVYQSLTIWGRLQFRANGIWCYVGLVRWKQIVSWKWTGSTGTTLLVQSRSRLGMLATGAVPIPHELKARVEELMTTHTGTGPRDD